MKYGIYIRFVEGHGRWLRQGIPSRRIAESWAEEQSEHWSESTVIEVWEGNSKSVVKFIRGKLPRLPAGDE